MATEEHDARTIRAAENQSLFREINERIEDLSEGFAAFSEVTEWVCECADTACADRISMTISEYEDVRSEGNRFAVLPRHEVSDVEMIVGGVTGRYLVVKKIGPGADRARRLDPRSESSSAASGSLPG